MVGRNIICICDENVNYLQLIQRYLLKRKITSIDIRFFSELDKLILETAKEEVFMCLINENMIGEKLSKINAKKIFILQEKQQSCFEYPSILKYQPMEKILEKVIEEIPKDLNQEKNITKTKVITFFETQKIKSELSGFIVAKHLASLGNKILYLNFSPFIKFDFLTNTKGNDVSDLLYYLLKDAGNVSKKIEILKNEREGVDFFLPAVNFEDLLELTGFDWQKILEGLEHIEGYDKIVLEINSANRGITEIYDKSVVFYMQEQDEGMEPLKNYLEMKGISDKRLKSYEELDLDYWKGKLKKDGV